MKRCPLFIIIVLTILIVSIPGLVISVMDMNFSYPAAAVMIQSVKNGELMSHFGKIDAGADDPDAIAAAALKEAEERRKQSGMNTVNDTGDEKKEDVSEKTTEMEEVSEEDTEEPEDGEEEENKEDAEEDEEEELKEFTTVDDDYFEDACFVGDSRVQGLGLYSGLPATNYGIVSMTLARVFDKKCISTDAGKVTITEALAMEPQYGKIYLKFGLNELGWGTDEQFAEYYYSLIDYIKAVQPDAIIYVMGILHVTAGEEQKSNVFTNEKIDHRNEVIKEVAENEHVYYLDVNEVFTDEYGRMPEEDSFDGIHVKADAIRKWADYLKTHAVED